MLETNLLQTDIRVLPAIQNFGVVEGICISRGGIPKRPVDSVKITFAGLQGDGHNHEKHNRPTQAVCLQDGELLEELRSEGFPLFSGTIGENLTIRNLAVQKMAVGTVLEFSGGVVLQLTKERHPCYVLDSIDPRLKEVIKGRCGFYAQVLTEGVLQTGESIKPRFFLDKIKAGQYTLNSCNEVIEDLDGILKAKTP